MTGNQLIQLSQHMFRECYKGNLKPWFDHLDETSVYVGNGDPILVGKDAITKHFKNYIGLNRGNLLEENYYIHTLNEDTACVYGKFIIGIEGSDHFVISRFTLTFQEKENEHYIVHQQNSYEYLKFTQENTSKAIHFNDETLHFIHLLLNTKSDQKKIVLKSGRQQTIVIHPQTILYIQGNGKNTTIYCMDRILSCNESLNQIKEKLPKNFYQIHRSFIINTNYIRNIRRFEVELINNTVLPIPEKTYTKVREDLLELI